MSYDDEKRGNLTNSHRKKNSVIFNAMPGLEEDTKYEIPPLNIDPNAVDPTRKRRFSVSAESSDCKNEANFARKVYPKSENALKRIRNAIKNVFLFKSLDEQQRSLLVDAMFEKRVKKGETIIGQGDRGDYFYIIEKGEYQVWKSFNKVDKKQPLTLIANGTHSAKNKKLEEKENKEPQLVFSYEGTGSFGELALMYNSPRQATVKSTTKGVLWAVDRKTFRHIMLETTDRKRKRYDAFLKNCVPFLKDISDETRAQISNTLESIEFEQKETVCKQGDEPDRFYIIQRGTVDVVIRDQQSHKKVRTLTKGEFFGERGILFNIPRSATLEVTSNKLECACVSKADFLRLFQNSYFNDIFTKQFATYLLSDETNELDLSDIDE